MKKRILSMLLAIVMAVGVLPVSLLTTKADASPLSGGTYIKGNVTFNEDLFNATRTDFRDESIYTLIITRFYDGDSSNNIHCWDDGMAGNPDSDPAWRGDFKGLIEKLDYIKALGFTAVRLLPVSQCASGYDYHGSHPIDMTKVDFRYESDGYTYQDLIDACHSKELKVMQEVVLNDTSNFGEAFLGNMFDIHPEDYSDVTKAVTPTDLLLEKYPDYMNMAAREQFMARLDVLKGHIDPTNNPNEYYHREKNMGYETAVEQQGQIAGDCVDINTENPVVAEYLAEVCRMYARKSVDAICIVNAKYINRWTLNEGILPILRQKLAEEDLDLEIFYEVEARARETWNRGIPSSSVPFYSWAETEEEWIGNWDSTSPTANIQTSIDHYNAHLDSSVSPTSDNALLDGITYHAPDYSQSSGMRAIDFTMMWNFENANNAFRAATGGDKYMNDATWNLLSVDSVNYGPDGMEKTRYSLGTQAWAENLNLMFTFRGIPSILYGTEIEFQKDAVIDVGPNVPLSTTGRAYYGDHMEGTVTTNGFINYTADGTVAATLTSPLATHIRQLNAVRMSVPALRKGQYTTASNYVSGNMAFIRRYTNAAEGVDSLVLVTITDGATFKNIPNGKYVDAFSGDVQNVTNGTLTVTSKGKGWIAAYVCEATGFTGLSASVSGDNSDYVVEIDWNDGNGIIEPIVPNKLGYVQLPEAPASSEYPLKAWSINGVEYQPGAVVKFDEDCVATAVWDYSVYYTVTLSAAANGTVTANRTRATEGTEVTLAVTPAEGYELDTLTVTDATGNSVTVTDNKFVMPASNVTVAATFKAETLVPDGANMIYFDNTDGWDQVNAYAWDSSYNQLLGQWPGTAMIKISDTLYCIEIPEGAEFITFNNGAGGQTGDLTIPTDGRNLYSAGAWLTHTEDTPTEPAKLCMVSISLKGNIALNYYMRLSDEVLSDSTAYMQFTLADGTIIKIPVTEGVKTVRDGETYYVFSCAVNAKEMTDDVVNQFFYEGGSTAEHSYSVKTYADYILANSTDEEMKDLVTAMLNYGAASQIHFGYNTDKLANAGLEVPDYSGVTIEGFNAVSSQGTELAKFYSASLILKSETTLRFFFTGAITATYNGQELEVKQRSGLYYVDVVGIAAKDLDKNVTITINDGTNTADVTYNPMTYCTAVQNDTTGAFDQEMKDLVAALYLYNQAANTYFKEN